MTLHYEIKPVSGDPTAGAHVLHYYTFADLTEMGALNDSNLGTVEPTTTDVGRVARVGSASPYAFYILSGFAPVSWVQINSATVALHASTHASDGSDPISPASIGAVSTDDFVGLTYTEGVSLVLGAPQVGEFTSITDPSGASLVLDTGQASLQGAGSPVLGSSAALLGGSGSGALATGGDALVDGGSGQIAGGRVLIGTAHASRIQSGNTGSGSGGTQWLHTGSLTLYASTAPSASLQVGSLYTKQITTASAQLYFRDGDGAEYKLTPTASAGTSIQSVAAANSAGTDLTFARTNHVHAHGNQLGGALHANATTSLAGFLSSTDKTKLDGIAAGATVGSPLSSTSPNAIGTAAAGTSTTGSRSDHVHAHGNQLGGSLHANATTSIAGFLSAADKTKLDGVATGATNLALSSTAPANLEITSSVGVGTTAARADHVHKRPLTLTVLDLSGARTITATDHDTIVFCMNNDMTVTVPSGLPVGTTVGFLCAEGSSFVEIVAGSGTTLQYSAAFTAKTAQQRSPIFVTVLGNYGLGGDEYIWVYGDLEVAVV